MTEDLKFEDWFDPHNVEHLKAYRYLHAHGQWPDGFKPANIKMTPYWEPRIERKMVEAYIDMMLSKED